jgi:hypothetical protein
LRRRFGTVATHKGEQHREQRYTPSARNKLVSHHHPPELYRRGSEVPVRAGGRLPGSGTHKLGRWLPLQVVRPLGQTCSVWQGSAVASAARRRCTTTRNIGQSRTQTPVRTSHWQQWADIGRHGLVSCRSHRSLAGPAAGEVPAGTGLVLPPHGCGGARARSAGGIHACRLGFPAWWACAPAGSA